MIVARDLHLVGVVIPEGTPVRVARDDEHEPPAAIREMIDAGIVAPYVVEGHDLVRYLGADAIRRDAIA